MVTDYRVIKERIEWEDILNRFEESDIYFKYDYFDLYTNEGETPIMVYMESSFGKMAYPFMIRDISYHPNFKDKLPKCKYFDIGSPYGYSGPLVEADSPESKCRVIELFYSKFSDFCRDHSVVSEFIKFSPILKNYENMDCGIETTYLKKMVATDLQRYGDPIYGELKKRKRKDSNKCKRMGMTVEFEISPMSFHPQLSIYYDTMKRNGAFDFFFFPESYFEKMLSSLSEHILLASTFLDGVLIGFELCFIYRNLIHSHIGGTAEGCLKYSPSDLLCSEIIKWGHNNGYRYYHAGGGLSSDEYDSLYLYKKAFAKNTDFDFYLGKKIWNRDAYDYLKGLLNISDEDDAGFFPIYRL